MKRFAVLSAFLFLPLVAAAQDATLINGDVEHGGYAGIVTKVTPINGEAAVMLGLEGAWTIDNSMYVGVQGVGIVNNIEADKLQPNGKPYLMWINEAGGRIGYIHNDEDMIHFSAGALIGAGSIQLADRYPWRDPSRVETLGDQDYYFLVEPEVAAELNITSWMRAKVAGSYRFVTGVETEGIENSDVSGPAGSFTVMFGSF